MPVPVVGMPVPVPMVGMPVPVGTPWVHHAVPATGAVAAPLAPLAVLLLGYDPHFLANLARFSTNLAKFSTNLARFPPFGTSGYLAQAQIKQPFCHILAKKIHKTAILSHFG